MTGLIVIAVVMTAAAVAAVAIPLLRRPAKPAAKRAEYDLAVYRDQLVEIERDRERGLLDAAEAEAARVEVQRRMLAAVDAESVTETPPPVPGRVLAGGLAAALSTAAFGFYLVLGSPDVPNFPFAERNVGSRLAGGNAGPEHAEVAGLAAKLATRLKDNPGDLDGWILLARTYNTIGDLQGMVAAYRQALDLSGGRLDLAASYGEALVLAADGQVTAEAFRLFNDVVVADPFNPQARYYVGLALAQQNRVREALQAWVDLRAVSPAGAPWLDAVNEQIGRAEGDLKLAAGSVKPSAAAAALAKQNPPAAAAIPPRPAAPGQPGPSAADMEAASQMSAADRTEMIRGMVGRLAERLKANPDDLEGWRRLAQSYRVLGETEKAKEAQARVEALEKRRQ
ncbi:MAG: c-type cytochrome biogenesis protein CcmI [Rhodospirillales bacterium]|nr:c-type cytochrome biogenesis protein CcmI [Rhodospirillales bacterium]